MVLNPALYSALSTFGPVTVINASSPFTPLVERSRYGRPTIVGNTNAEHYALCCPLCRDTRPRLYINCGWLTAPFAGLPPLTHLAYCHHENCAVTGFAFISEVRKRMMDAGEGSTVTLPQAVAPSSAPAPTLCQLPRGLIPLDRLPPDHSAITFLAKKYHGLPPEYLASCYGAAYASEYDPDFRMAKGRIIFPIYDQGVLVGWQGRRVDDSKDMRWVLSRNFRKTVYNGDRVGHGETPIICEGITSSIACGPMAVAIFGKVLSETACAAFAQRWDSAIVALDPETFVRDPRANGRIFADELASELNRHCRYPVRCIQWPADVLSLARRKVAGEDVAVPDAADFGLVRMHELLGHFTPLNPPALLRQATFPQMEKA